MQFRVNYEICFAYSYIKCYRRDKLTFTDLHNSHLYIQCIIKPQTILACIMRDDMCMLVVSSYRAVVIYFLCRI